MKNNPVHIAITGALGFLTIMSAIHYIAYQSLPDMKFITQVIFLLGVIGAVPMVFKKYFFGGIFLISGTVGFIIDCIISIERNNQGRPNMLGGMLFILCLFVGFIMGIVVEIIVTLNRKKQVQ